ncbi:MAG: division/cell wall cluster transcriptional repressor MraZ [Rhodospirillaceae bacterium]
MSVFLSTFENKLDGKGRVSVPASFRSALDKQNSAGVVLFPSLRHACLEGCGDQRIEQIAESIDRLDAFSEEAEAMQTILADSASLSIDGDGRMVLPEKMIAFAGLENVVVFVGQGRQFQIWAPSRYQHFRDHNRDIARERGLSLRMVPRDGGGAP